MNSRLADITARLDAACRQAGRKRQDVAFMAVTKGRPAADIEGLIAHGVTLFGENRAQDVQEKWPAIKTRHPAARIHFIGHLQTNKIKDVYATCDGLHSLDRPELAQTLAKVLHAQPKSFDIYIQVNTGEEPQKGGVTPEALPDFLRLCQADLKLPVRGLMVLPPAETPPAPHFALLHKLAAASGVTGLSMGMSADFDVAIRYRSTLIRVGSALFEDK